MRKLFIRINKFHGSSYWNLPAEKMILFKLLNKKNRTKSFLVIYMG